MGDDKNTRRIVVLGKTGVGKSSVANTMFGEKLFDVSSLACSETSKCKAKTKTVNGRSLTLIDTPGFFDTEKSEEDLKFEILRCITASSPGPHAFLIVLKVEKFIEQDVINKIQEYFSDDIFKHATVVFTHGDQLDEGLTIEDFVQSNKCLIDLVQKCGGWCHVIDSKCWNKKDEYRSNEVQVEKLLKTIDKMVEENNGGCYTNKMLKAVEGKIQQEEKYISLQSGNMTEEEIREQAKGSVDKKLLLCVGCFTGTILLRACNDGGLTSGTKAGAMEEMLTREVHDLVKLLVRRVARSLVDVGAETPQEAAKRTEDAATDS